MIFYNGNIVYGKDSRIQQFKSSRFSVYFKGLVFVYGKKAGAESIAFILEQLESKGEIEFAKIFGTYFIYILDHQKDRHILFSDNSAMFNVYIYKDYISTSFLEAIDYIEEINSASIDRDALTEFMHFGFSYFNRTFIKDLRIINSKHYYVYENATLSKNEKKLKKINKKPRIDINEFFKNLVYAIEDLNVSIDITGGFDSRLILSYFLKHDSDFELAISGQPDTKDVIIGEKISSLVHKDFFSTLHEVDRLSLKVLKDIFEKTDGQLDVINYHRNYELNNDRLERGVQIQLSGVGGALFKDFCWFQDFPFYNKKKTNLNRLYNYRIERIKFDHDLLGKRLLSKSLDLKENTLKRLENYVLDTNTQSYDNVYYNYKMKTNTGTFLTATNNFFISYGPLFEYQLLRIGFNLKRRMRFFENYHRNIITRNNPELAKIKTTNATRASSQCLYKSWDYVLIVIEKGKRLFKEVLRKLLNKEIFNASLNDENIYRIWKSKDYFKESVEYFKNLEILSQDLQPENIPDFLVGKITTLYFLYQRLDSKSFQKESAAKQEGQEPALSP